MNKMTVYLAAFFFLGPIGCSEVQDSAGGVLDNGASLIREVGSQPWYVGKEGTETEIEDEQYRRQRRQGDGSTAPRQGLQE